MTSVDINICENIKIYRLMSGLTQSKLAEQLGITPQQLNKYEKGIDRVSVAMLVNMAHVFSCNVNDLLKNLGVQNEDKRMSALKVNEDGEKYQVKKKTSNNYAIEMLKIFLKMDKKNQEKILEQIKSYSISLKKKQ